MTSGTVSVMISINSQSLQQMIAERLTIEIGTGITIFAHNLHLYNNKL